MHPCSVCSNTASSVCSKPAYVEINFAAPLRRLLNSGFSGRPFRCTPAAFAQTHENTKTQKHKNTKTHTNTKTPSLASLERHFAAARSRLLKHSLSGHKNQQTQTNTAKTQKRTKHTKTQSLASLEGHFAAARQRLLKHGVSDHKNKKTPTNHKNSSSPHFSSKTIISHQKLSFLIKNHHFSSKNHHFSSKTIISQAQPSFLIKNHHFSSKIIISHPAIISHQKP